VCGAWLLAVAVTCPTRAFGQSVLDQDHPGSGTLQPIPPGYVTAQTFTAGITGALTQVNLAIVTQPIDPRCNFFPQFPGCVPGDLMVSIRETLSGTAYMGNGFFCSIPSVLTIPTNADLASATISASAVPYFTDYNPTPITIQFAAPAHVVAGHVYAIVVQSGGSADHLWAAAETFNVDSYPEGTIFSTWNFGQPSGAWCNSGDHATYESPQFQKFYIKMQFQTFVAPCPVAASDLTITVNDGTELLAQFTPS